MYCFRFPVEFKKPIEHWQIRARQRTAKQRDEENSTVIRRRFVGYARRLSNLFALYNTERNVFDQFLQ